MLAGCLSYIQPGSCHDEYHNGEKLAVSIRGASILCALTGVPATSLSIDTSRYCKSPLTKAAALSFWPPVSQHISCTCLQTVERTAAVLFALVQQRSSTLPCKVVCCVFLQYVACQCSECLTARTGNTYGRKAAVWQAYLSSLLPVP
jgi:hypothetical protein